MVEPVFSTVHEHEELACLDFPENSSKDLEENKITGMKMPKGCEKQESILQQTKELYPSEFIEVQNDPSDGMLSVVSDITNLSDKLFLRVEQSEDSKWDDMSSVGFSGAEGRPQTDKLIYLGTSYMLNMEEVAGRITDVPPVYYDASVKTPPLLYYPTLNDKFRVANDANPESKWDDVSSIGLTGVEGLRNIENRRPTRDNGCVPVVITSHYMEDRNLKQTTIEKVDRSQEIFRKPTNDKKTAKSCGLEINPTFSTVQAEESDTSSSSGNFQYHDPEMQIEKEVSNTSVSSKNSKESTRSWVLTSHDWTLLAAMLFVTVVAIAIVVFYVYANL
jgi:hypothetical protein